jgi:FMN-dependent NADH-azoreductase
MSNLLFIESSPRKDASASTSVARTFIAEYRRLHPDHTVETLDVWNTPMPEFDGDALQAKYAALYGVERTPSQAAAWKELGTIAARIRTAERLLIGIPMWNFGIPYKLKHLIDATSQKDLLFTFEPSGFGGLAEAKKAAVIYARGIDYGPDAAFATPADEWDQQKPYMDLWLRFIGVPDVSSIVIEKTLMGADASEAALVRAHAAAVKLAAQF